MNVLRLILNLRLDILRLILDGKLNLRLSDGGVGGDLLSLDRDVVNNFFNSINGNVFNSGFISRLRNIFDLVFNGVIISVLSLDGNVFGSLDL